MDKRKEVISLIEREVTDENFIHCLTLLAMSALWLEGVEEGYEIEYNDRNMMQIPVEIAMAFVRDKARDQGKLAEAARACLATYEEFRRKP